MSGPEPLLTERIATIRKEIAVILPKRDDATVSTLELKAFQQHVRTWKSQS